MKTIFVSTYNGEGYTDTTITTDKIDILEEANEVFPTENFKPISLVSNGKSKRFVFRDRHGDLNVPEEDWNSGALYRHITDRLITLIIAEPLVNTVSFVDFSNIGEAEAYANTIVENTSWGDLEVKDNEFKGHTEDSSGYKDIRIVINK